MARPFRIFMFLIGVLLLTVACVIPGAPAADENLISTHAAQTVIAGLTSTAAQPPAGTATLTFTSEPPTSTPTETPTETPTLTPTVTFTPTSIVPLISVSVPTNCRTGPGKVYGLSGSLLVGQVAEVLGRNPTGQYWYIRNPGGGADYCWVWGEYATLTGPYMLLPVFTPPPTPTPTMTPTPTNTPIPAPDFSADFAGLETCANWWVEFKLVNKGPVAFKSYKIEIKDTVTNGTLAALADGFANVDGCSKTTTKDRLNPGDTFTLSSPQFAYNPAGNALQVSIQLCSELSQKGTCVERKLNITP